MISGAGITHSTTFVKIHQLTDGSVVGFSGCVYGVETALDALNKESEWQELDTSFEALLLDTSGDCWSINHKGQRYRQSSPCVSGSGGSIALGAMLAGKTAEEAVEIAAQADQSTGGQIISLSPSPPSYHKK
jgi:hypothetical protein